MSTITICIVIIIAVILLIAILCAFLWKHFITETEEDDEEENRYQQLKIRQSAIYNRLIVLENKETKKAIKEQKDKEKEIEKKQKEFEKIKACTAKQIKIISEVSEKKLQKNEQTILKLKEENEKLEKLNSQNSIALNEKIKLEKNNNAKIKKLEETNNKILEEKEKNEKASALKIKELEDSTANKIKELEDKNASKIKQLEDSNANKIKELEDSHSSIIKKIEDASNSKIHQIEESNANKIKQLEDSHSSLVKKMEDASNSKIKQLEDTNANKIKQLESESNSKIKKLEDSSNAKIRKLEEENDQIITVTSSKIKILTEENLKMKKLLEQQPKLIERIVYYEKPKDEDDEQISVETIRKTYIEETKEVSSRKENENTNESNDDVVLETSESVIEETIISETEKKEVEVVEEIKEENEIEKTDDFEITDETLDDFDEEDDEIEDDEDESDIDESDVEEVERKKAPVRAIKKSVKDEDNEDELNLENLGQFVEKKRMPTKRRTFAIKLSSSTESTKRYFSEITNKIRSYGLTARVGKAKVLFRLNKEAYFRMLFKGKRIVLCLPLDPHDPKYDENIYKQMDYSNKAGYDKFPFAIKITNKNSVDLIIALIEEVAKNLNFELNQKFKEVNYVEKYPDVYSDFEKDGYGYLIKEEIHKSDVEIYEIQFAGDILLEKKIDEPAPNKIIKAEITLDEINQKISDTKTGVDLQLLKEKDIVAKNTNYLVVKTGEVLSKPLTIYADEFEPQAIMMICLTGGKAVKLTYTQAN